MNDTQLSAIQSVAAPELAKASAELVELSAHNTGRQIMLRFLVDKVGGVTVHDCTRLNQAIGQALEDAGFMHERYTLEVSSPGLDRPLKTLRDFERAIGEEIDVELVQPLENLRKLTGLVLSVQDDAIVVKTDSGNVTVPLAQIQRAHKTIQW